MHLHSAHCANRAHSTLFSCPYPFLHSVVFLSALCVSVDHSVMSVGKLAECGRAGRPIANAAVFALSRCLLVRGCNRIVNWWILLEMGGRGWVWFLQWILYVVKIPSCERTNLAIWYDHVKRQFQFLCQALSHALY